LKTYDALFIFAEQNLTDEALGGIEQKIRAEIEKVGGRVSEATALGRRGFSRRLHKKEAGYYLHLIFEVNSDQVAPLRARFRLMEFIFRVQVTAMSAEDRKLWTERKNRKPVEERMGDR
jgi:ribosomal protein S6